MKRVGNENQRCASFPASASFVCHIALTHATRHAHTPAQMPSFCGGPGFFVRALAQCGGGSCLSRAPARRQRRSHSRTAPGMAGWTSPRASRTGTVSVLYITYLLTCAAYSCHRQSACCCCAGSCESCISGASRACTRGGRRSSATSKYVHAVQQCVCLTRATADSAAVHAVRDCAVCLRVGIASLHIHGRRVGLARPGPGMAIPCLA